MEFARYFLIGFLLHSCLCRPNNCKKCAQIKTDLSLEELRQLRYEYLKNQILKKLHLTEPPKTNLPKPPLKTLLAITEMVQNETTSEIEDQPHVESVVIYPKEGNLSCSDERTSPCSRYEFTVPESLTAENFLSAEVWFYTNNTESIRAYQVLTDNPQNSTNSFALDNVIEKKIKQWSKYNIPESSFGSSFINIVENIVIEKTDAGDNLEGDAEEKPFIVIRSKTSDILARSKRSSTCTEGSTSCCKETFFLNFSEIGWNNWILHPDGYQANFCRGRCFNDLSNTRFYHSAVLLSYIRDNRDFAEEIGLNMCCTPSVMAPVDIIYRNEEGLIYHKAIENMKVEACDCA